MILKCDKYLSNTSVRDNRDISILALSFWVGWQADISTQLIVLLWQSTTSAWLSTLHFVEHWMNSPCWVSWESCYLCFFFVLFCLFLLFLQPNCNNYNVNPLEQFWPSQLHPVKKKLVLATHIVILRVWHRYRDGFQQRRTFLLKRITLL